MKNYIGIFCLLLCLSIGENDLFGMFQKPRPRSKKAQYGDLVPLDARINARVDARDHSDSKHYVRGSAAAPAAPPAVILQDAKRAVLDDSITTDRVDVVDLETAEAIDHEEKVLIALFENLSTGADIVRDDADFLFDYMWEHAPDGPEEVDKLVYWMKKLFEQSPILKSSVEYALQNYEKIKNPKIIALLHEQLLVIKDTETLRREQEKVRDAKAQEHCFEYLQKIDVAKNPGEIASLLKSLESLMISVLDFRDDDGFDLYISMVKCSMRAIFGSVFNKENDLFLRVALEAYFELYNNKHNKRREIVAVLYTEIADAFIKAPTLVMTAPFLQHDAIRTFLVRNKLIAQKFVEAGKYKKFDIARYLFEFYLCELPNDSLRKYLKYDVTSDLACKVSVVLKGTSVTLPAIRTK